MAANTAWAACPTCTGAPPDAADISDPQQRHAGPVELPRREQVLGADPPQRAPLAARREDEHGVGGVPDPDAVPRGRFKVSIETRRGNKPQFRRLRLRLLHQGRKMSSFKEERSEGKVPATAIDPTNEKKKRTKMVRYTQDQIQYCFANSVELSDDDEDDFKLTEVLSKECLGRMSQEYLAKLYAMEIAEEKEKANLKKIQDVLRNERENIFNIREKPEDVLKQYHTKGYAEYEVVVDDDKGDEDNKVHARVAPPGRRRFRNGVAMKKNQSGGGSIIRKIN
uniref:Uncharacterized protein n=1 Tax=Oryza sativa subsp. japonica TaxID=39947 RepID=Q339I5_ORYSJ|nr:hypothetical protein LOC_Os10g21040 [Oryza sativa Japonica Group]